VYAKVVNLWLVIIVFKTFQFRGTNVS